MTLDIPAGYIYGSLGLPQSIRERFVVRGGIHEKSGFVGLANAPAIMIFF
jgi:hypothetical protein